MPYDYFAAWQKKDTSRKADDFKRLLKYYHFNEKGYFYVPARMDEGINLEPDWWRKRGFFYDRLIGWYKPTVHAKMLMKKIDAHEVLIIGNDGRYHLDKFVTARLIEAYRKENLTEKEKTLSYIADIGARKEFELEFIGEHLVRSNSDFGDYHVFHFRSPVGNEVRWFQRNYAEKTLSDFCAAHRCRKTLRVTGTVKDHTKNRNMVPLTYLSRCVILSPSGHDFHTFAAARREIIGEDKNVTIDEESGVDIESVAD